MNWKTNRYNKKNSDWAHAIKRKHTTVHVIPHICIYSNNHIKKELLLQSKSSECNSSWVQNWFSTGCCFDMFVMMWCARYSIFEIFLILLFYKFILFLFDSITFYGLQAGENFVKHISGWWQKLYNCRVFDTVSA